MAKILYYYWKEHTGRDCIEVLRRLGNEVTVYDEPLHDYDRDDAFMEGIQKELAKGYDAVFSFNYFPVLSRAVRERSILYISWVFDAPHATLNSTTVRNPLNRIFIFDKRVWLHYSRMTGANIFYMPLAVNTERLSEQLAGCMPGKGYRYDISFLGSLYRNEQNFYDRIEKLPEELKGYIDGLTEAQQLIFGYDMVEEIFNDARCEELAGYVKVDLGPLYLNCRNDILRTIVRTHITAEERTNLIRILGERYALSLFSEACPPADLPVRFCGYADYMTKMPEVFRQSKINLNITLRTITSGISLRVLDILGAQGFCLTNYQEELPQYFDNGVHLAWYESQPELVEKAAYYLAHDEERERIALAGYERVREVFSYEKLLTAILQKAFAG